MIPAILLSLALSASALPNNFGRRDDRGDADDRGAVYFLTNGAQNSVAALHAGRDGKLSDGTVTVTGGAGGNAVNAMTGVPAGPDALFSQQPLTVVDNVSGPTMLLYGRNQNRILTSLESLRRERRLKHHLHVPHPRQ
jgi:hypothetical protein